MDDSAEVPTVTFMPGRKPRRKKKSLTDTVVVATLAAVVLTLIGLGAYYLWIKPQQLSYYAHENARRW